MKLLLLRCTGYRPILEGLKTLTSDRWAASNGSNGASGDCGMGEKCCKNGNNLESEPEYSKVLFDSKEFIPYDPSQEPIFPPELQLDVDLDRQFLTFSSSRVTWYRPVSLDQMLTLKQRHPESKIVVGNTELGVEVKFKHCDYPVYISPGHVKEFNQVYFDDV